MRIFDPVRSKGRDMGGTSESFSGIFAGRWDLGLAEGRSREMYEMLDAQAVERRLASNERNFTTAHGRPSQSVALHSLSGAHLLLPLRKRPEFAGQDVLEVRTCTSSSNTTES